MVEWYNTRPTIGLVRVQNPAGGDWHGAIDSFFLSDPGLNPSEHKLLTPPPPRALQPPKCRIQFQGDRGLKIKNPLGFQQVQ